MEIIGHRGAKGLAPENTLAGITFALNRRVDWIEIDVQSTKDGETVILHDRTLYRIARDRGRAKRYTLAELKKLATRSGETIPTLEEVLKLVGRRAKLDIELKDTESVSAVIKAIELEVANGRLMTDFLVSSLTIRPLRALRRRNKQIRLAYLHRLWPFTFLLLKSLRLSAVGFFGMVAPTQAIQLAKKRGLWVMVYTVNHKAIAERLAKKGVDAIITDTPQAFRPLTPIVLRWIIGALIIGGLLLLAYYIGR
jgi:glycerophosphoryl diester phosphodiesterase